MKNFKIRIKEWYEMKNKGVICIILLVLFLCFSPLHAFPEYRGGAERAGYGAGCSLDPEAMGHVYTANVSAAGVNLSQPVSDGGYGFVGTALLCCPVLAVVVAVKTRQGCNT